MIKINYEIVYVGMTHKSLSERLLEHKNDRKSKRKYDWLHSSDCEIFLIKDNLTFKEAQEVEDEMINKYVPTLNRTTNKEQTQKKKLAALKKAEKMKAKLYVEMALKMKD